MALEPITTLPPPDESRFLYTYYGKRLWGMNQPLFMLDKFRTQPTIVLGTTGYGKTEFLLSQCIQDSLKNRPVFFLDGKCEIDTMHKLYYYTTYTANRWRTQQNITRAKQGLPLYPMKRFYSFFPVPNLDQYTYSWNPLLCSMLNIDDVAEAFFNAYSLPTRQDTDGTYYTDRQREVFKKLLSALNASGLAYNTQDVRVVLEYEDMLDALSKFIKGAGVEFYADLVRIRNANKKEFRKDMQGLINHLMQFRHWSLNSYNPAIQFDQLLATDAVVYIGLPLNMQNSFMRSVGNILINQLKALSGAIQANSGNRRLANVTIDEAGSFVDNAFVDWVCKVRSSGMLLTLACQGIADLEEVGKGFSERILINTPHTVVFNPRCLKTAKWFSGLSGTEQIRTYAANVKSEENEDISETGAGTLKLAAADRVPAESLMHLQMGQCMFKPGVKVGRAFRMASPYLPKPELGEWVNFTRQYYPEVEAVQKGLNLVPLLNQVRRQVGSKVLANA